jgi:putative GTP pyrophosphokinase
MRRHRCIKESPERAGVSKERVRASEISSARRSGENEEAAGRGRSFLAHSDEQPLYDEVSPNRVAELSFCIPTGGVAMSAYADKLVEEYKARRQGYVSFTQSVRDLLHQLIKVEGLDTVGIEDRTKELDSFKEKMDRPEKAQKYQSCADVTDLSGVRIICYLEQDSDKICQIIRKNFVIDEANSANKESLLDPDKFGYRSMHLVVSYGEDRLKLAEFKNFKEMKAEVQVRTILQHTWAAIDWKLRYKTDIGVPRDIRRRLYRISALLESAEDDFTRVSQLVHELRATYEQQIQKGNLAIEVNQESLDAFLTTSETVQRLKLVSERTGYVIGPPHPRSRNPLLNLSLTLHTAAIEDISELENQLEKAEPQAQEFLAQVHKAWWTPGKPRRLAVDLGTLIRLFVIQTADQKVAQAILDKSPFGPELNKAVQIVKKVVA